MNSIKLVIWDLDETFWKGTLSEEGIEPIREHVRLVGELTDRGIINSIASKNDFEQARQALRSLGVWEYFVFPAIQWAPKGTRIADIIAQCRLRAENVLFLDDNHLNLKEAGFYNPGLHTRSPDFIQNIRTHPAFAGKDDTNHARLNQYKILETKADARRNFNSNTEFLQSSNIRIAFIEDMAEHKDRIVELLGRTNQLNFTKVRSTAEKVDALIADRNYTSALLHVRDNFGDYGLVGFYSLHQPTQRLEHFVFSCRILNLGVAQYVYHKLGCPELKIVPKVAEPLDGSQPDWITEVSGEESADALTHPVRATQAAGILFKGGCDLRQMFFYLQGASLAIEEEINYVAANNFTVHRDHTQTLLDALLLSPEDRRYVQTSSYIPFADEGTYRTRVFDVEYDCLVYSVLKDYTQEIYEHKTRRLRVPYGGYGNHWTDPANHRQIVESHRAGGRDCVTEQTLKDFTQNFRHVGQITPGQFIDNLRQIRSMIPAHKPIVFINGCEVRHARTTEIGDVERHRVMNEALDAFIAESENTHLLDVRCIVTGASQLTSNIRHYDRAAYRQMAVRLLEILNSVLAGDIYPRLSVDSLNESHASYARRILRKFKRLMRIPA